MGKKILVLVVDDDRTLVDFLVEVLRRAKYVVEAAYGGTSGCEKAAAQKPNLVVLDLMMPDMHGFDVCQAIRKDRSLQGTKILISSAKGYDVDKKAARRLGADSFLVKPYTPEKLLEVVRELVGAP